MRTVHIGIGHDDDLAVAQAVRVEVVDADPGSQGRDDREDLLVAEDLVEALLSEHARLGTVTKVWK